MSKAGEAMAKLIIEVTPESEKVLRLFVKECCSNNNNKTHTFSRESLEYFIKAHKTKVDEKK